MKFLAKIILIIIITTQIIFAQNTRVTPELSLFYCTYSLSYKPDSLAEGRKTELMLLTIGKNISLFAGISSHKADSILASPTFNQISMNAMVPYMKTDFNYKLYKKPASNLIIYYDRIGPNTLYEVTQRNTSMQWNIGSTVKMVAGYSCRQATTQFAGRQWEAWFTTEVPVSNGPYKFGGLPGLITEVYDTKNNYHFSLIQLKKATTAILLAPPANLPKTDELAFKKSRDEYMLNGVTKVIKNNTGGSQENFHQQLQEYKQKQARKNNPLELR